jgi:hypothetical protein
MRSPNKTRIEKRIPSLRNSPAAMSSIIHHMRREDAENVGIIAGACGKAVRVRGNPLG